MKSALRQDITSIMDAAKDLAIATVREDGFPQNTTVSFVHDGMAIYFACDSGSQKATNLLRDNRASITMTAPYDEWQQIKGLSMSARAHHVTEAEEVERFAEMVRKRFPEVSRLDGFKDTDLAVFKVVPEVVSVLDYTKGFGHTDFALVTSGDITQTKSPVAHIWLPTGA